MSKRNKIKIESTESKALKALRIKSGHSIRKLADKIDVSPTRVHQMEAGLENVSKTYVQVFLEAAGLTWQDWFVEIEQEERCECEIIRERCYEILDQLVPSKVEQVYKILLPFA
ncbi:MAG: hypothetical protein A2451_12380 [Bdellovibrionales bacterium RIFOXYC2_FULL_39_8]|nr:MAG: hypothetical protein A2385_12770 [Bdellovibrionales bacterium RIFOXYB1_FULL_39_21]OFZ43702.1 MAG: hypothetical protein A2485_04705 [Bdellovibrionales bacterium RIFOXYC12_FULL_39_17]OFZ46448.1 MAG: hypothetical protein A2404_08625 [Bdellovibrionales bacterium RIFOXYC1_FULL_39_130]OFZ72156.1 MAG: hypothetical protein A2451_12380 [Bdellovibrionales bacterium RIFOXYC2_FULL_39_8]OFZ75162.1 MAG: hypothetical protein A2560_10640 [Bdellovibrionales bacterium RIFOXYD1_FULL_39_84]HLE11353.1 heli